MRFNISCKIWIKYHLKVLKHLLPRCSQEKMCFEKISFKINQIKCIASIYFFLFAVYFSHELGNSQILKLPWQGSFSYLREMQPSRVILENKRSWNFERTKKVFWRCILIGRKKQHINITSNKFAIHKPVCVLENELLHWHFMPSFMA